MSDNSSDELLALNKHLKFLHYVNPINIKEEKEKFLFTHKNPTFEYRKIEYDTKEVEKRLDKIEIPQGSFSELYQEKIMHLKRIHRVITNIGISEIVQKTTKEMYGEPDSKLINLAEQNLKKTAVEEEDQTVRPEEMVDHMARVLHSYKLYDWKSELSGGITTTPESIDKKISVGNKEYSPLDFKRFSVHEVSHIIRAVNGYNQPHSMFATGLHNYLTTEEGLCMFLQEAHGVMPPLSKIKISASVIAIDCLEQGFDFKNTFDRLKSLDLSDDLAWEKSLRAHRGGGCNKDHVYLLGYQQVKEFAETDNLGILYAGKIGVHHVPLVKNLIEKGELNPPKVLPHFL